MRRTALAITIIATMLVGCLSVIVASWTSAAGEQLSGANGLHADYFSDPGLTNLALSRIDPKVSFSWGREAPADVLGSDNFSVRWTGQVVPRYSEPYTFYTFGDDGVRLWVDGQLLIDDWVQQTVVERQGTIALEAGKPVELRLEYVDYDANAMIRLHWSSPSQPRVTIPQRRLLLPGVSLELPSPEPTTEFPTPEEMAPTAAIEPTPIAEPTATSEPTPIAEPTATSEPDTSGQT
jgi:hypothetical protein